ncbi:MAG: transcriptional regulator, IclR family [Conexibacter sp.]|nr:transcriptional regulator, IclR family [Actinomycetes bacterium]MCW2985806.1 transcriptional regulator, IclR family [Conexibacter sp.]
MLGTVLRAGEVLDLFTVDEPEWGVTDIAAEMGLCKSTAHTLLASLESIGLLEHAAASRRYRLGWRTLTLGRTALVSSVFRDAAQRVMHRMIEQYGETMHLAAWDRGAPTCVLRSQPRSGVRLPVDLTLTRRGVPAHVTSVGKVLLASRPACELLQTLAGPDLEGTTANSTLDRDLLATELAGVRARGHAQDREEAFEGIACVAAPITFEGKVVAAVSMSAEAGRFAIHAHEYTTAITRAAHAVSVGIAVATDAAESTSTPRALSYA